MHCFIKFPSGLELSKRTFLIFGFKTDKSRVHLCLFSNNNNISLSWEINLDEWTWGMSTAALSDKILFTSIISFYASTKKSALYLSIWNSDLASIFFDCK